MVVIEFLEANKAHSDQIKSEWIENLSGDKVSEYESIYRAHMDKRFMVTKWCKNCVFKMVQRVWNWYENQES